MESSKQGERKINQPQTPLTGKAKIQMLGFYYSLYATFQVIHFFFWGSLYKAQLHLLSELAFSSPLSKELIRYQQIMLLRLLQRQAFAVGFPALAFM